MSQNIIDTGQAANDGTGEPLRQAFTAINNNFSQIWSSGPVNSNIQISNNQIATLQTNQDLVLVPNGIGNVQANATIVPGVGNIYDLGSSDRRWDTVWTQYIDVFGPATFNNLNVDGNLTVQGNIIEIGNIVTDSKTIQLANTAANASAANGSGITVGANDNIATMLYSSTSNTWTMNIGASITGNVTAPYFIGNGSLLTGIATSYSNANVVSLLANFGSNTINTTGNISAPDGDGSILFNVNGNIGTAAGFNYDRTSNTMFVETGSFAGHPDTGVQGLYVGRGSYTILGSPILGQFTSDIDSYSQINLQNINTGNSASGDYIITADIGTDTTYFIDMGLASSNYSYAGYGVIGPNDGYLFVAGADQAGPFTGTSNLNIGSTNGAVRTWVGAGELANVITTVGPDGVSVAGNIIPATSNVYSLGNSTNQWSDLYVSNATIYMNNVPISLTAGNILTVNGQDVVTTNTDGNTVLGNLQVIGSGIYIAYGSPETLINISPDPEGWAYLQLPDDATANSYNTRLHNDAGNVEIGTGNFSTGSNSYTWTFDNTGVLTAQGNITTTGIVSGQTLVSTQSAANEGGEITLALPSSGSTLGGNIIIDSYQNQVRIFEGGGNSRGLYVDVPNVSTSGQYAIGYRDVPQIALSGNITANSITAGKHFYSTTAGNLQVTIPDNANVAFPTGATITVVVNAAGNVIIAQGTGVSLYMAGSSTTGDRAVGAYGLASIMKVATDTWVISGTGVY